MSQRLSYIAVVVEPSPPFFSAKYENPSASRLERVVRTHILLKGVFRQNRQFAAMLILVNVFVNGLKKEWAKRRGTCRYAAREQKRWQRTSKALTRVGELSNTKNRFTLRRNPATIYSALLSEARVVTEDIKRVRAPYFHWHFVPVANRCKLKL